MSQTATYRSPLRSKKSARDTVPNLPHLADHDGMQYNLPFFERGHLMKTFIAILLACAAVSASAAPALAASNNEAQIKALEDQFAAAANAKNLDAIMKVYAPGKDLLVFDVVPPRQYAGWDAYKKDWQEFLAGFKGPIKFTVSDLAITASGDMAFSHSIQSVSGMDTKGKATEMTVRVTDVYRKTSGKWLIVHEHVSVPVNLDTAKPDMNSTP